MKRWPRRPLSLQTKQKTVEKLWAEVDTRRGKVEDLRKKVDQLRAKQASATERAASGGLASSAWLRLASRPPKPLLRGLLASRPPKPLLRSGSTGAGPNRGSPSVSCKAFKRRRCAGPVRSQL